MVWIFFSLYGKLTLTGCWLRLHIERKDMRVLLSSTFLATLWIFSHVHYGYSVQRNFSRLRNSTWNNNEVLRSPISSGNYANCMEYNTVVTKQWHLAGIKRNIYYLNHYFWLHPLLETNWWPISCDTGNPFDTVETDCNVSCRNGFRLQRLNHVDDIVRCFIYCGREMSGEMLLVIFIGIIIYIVLKCHSCKNWPCS